MSQPKIVSSGYVSLDITPAFPAEGKKRSFKEIIRPGKLVEVGKATIAPGGSVSNTGLALHLFGVNTVLIGKIGNDNFGRILLSEYQRLGANPHFVVSEEDETSYTVAIAPPGFDRIFFADSGANNTMTADDIDLGDFADAQIFHFGYPTLMRRFFQHGGEESIRLYKKVKEAGLITSLDTTMVDEEAPAGKENWQEIFQRLLPYVDFFTPSFEEICALILPDHYAALLKEAGDDDICLHLSISRDLVPLADKLLEMGAKAVLLKCGAAGMFLKTKGQEDMEAVFANGRISTTAKVWANQTMFQKSFKPDRIASGTGAGDTAIAAFLYSLAKGFEPRTCLENAAGTGAMNITRYDSLSGLLPIPELMQRIRDGWETQDFISD